MPGFVLYFWSHKCKYLQLPDKQPFWVMAGIGLGGHCRPRSLCVLSRQCSHSLVLIDDCSVQCRPSNNHPCNFSWKAWNMDFMENLLIFKYWLTFFENTVSRIDHSHRLPVDVLCSISCVFPSMAIHPLLCDNILRLFRRTGVFIRRRPCLSFKQVVYCS